MKRAPNPKRLTAARAQALEQVKKRGGGVTFGTLHKGERFRFWSALVPTYQRPVYTKMSDIACRDEHGQWFDISTGTRVERTD